MKPASQTLRQMLRSLVPESAYLMLARQYAAVVAARRIGWIEYRRLKRVSRAPRGGASEFRAPGIAHPVAVRPGTTDAGVFKDILLRDIYGVLTPREPVRFIIDAGANVGFSSVFFANRWPEARIVALEPESGNHAQAVANGAPYPQVSVLKLALWPTRAHLKIQGDQREDAIRVVEVADAAQADCEAIDPLTVAREAGAERISIFKCDIEGGEEPLFGRNPDPWLEITDNIMMEIHSPAAGAAVYGAMARHPFESFRYRELHVFTRR
ncbi:MAG: FkbM family methyltransferase [Phycisphaerales bacterium]|nr:FkbM family methyltransferase [Phycisphaerales bacterium]